MRHHLALVALLAFTGSVAEASPGRRAEKRKKHKKVAPERDIRDEIDAVDDEESEAPRKRKRGDTHVRALASPTIDEDEVDEDEVDPDEDDEIEAPRRKPAKRKRVEDDSERVAVGEEIEEEDVDVSVREVATTKKQAKDWHIAIGPYLWASSVDADVSLGSASIATGVDFFDISRHAKYGVEVLVEARYKRFAFYGDLLYGVVGVGGGTDVGPLMVKLDGTASSLLADGLAGYRLLGSERSLFSFEARAGVRYQRTEISGSVNVAGTDVSPSTYIDSAADALAGAQAVLRPHRRFFVSGAFDHGVFGQSTSTWSATGDAGVNITRRVRLSLGWRTLTTTRTNVSIVMHGPRAALQLVF